MRNIAPGHPLAPSKFPSHCLQALSHALKILPCHPKAHSFAPSLRISRHETHIPQYEKPIPRFGTSIPNHGTPIPSQVHAIPPHSNTSSLPHSDIRRAPIQRPSNVRTNRFSFFRPVFPLRFSLFPQNILSFHLFVLPLPTQMPRWRNR